ncbi:MAG TPA: hypothetical protein VHE35_00125 [Kofleriaceae bacterium]|nr:hypothetical protein [Kofleriaceae bacterium]
MAERAHILDRLVLPAKYERLELRVGADLVKLLAPPRAALDVLMRVAASVKKTYEGAFVPVVGPPGAGKTTLANSLSYFYPADFAPTLRYQGAITFEALTDTVTRFRQSQGIVNGRILPVSIDHREGAPPTDEELAAIKRFVRTTQAPMLVLWLETDRARADQIAARHVALTGASIVPLPVVITGPDRATWQDIALHTLELCNNLPAGEIVEIGVDPRTYDPGRVETVGEFLKQIANDFANLLVEHQTSSIRPLTLVIQYVSESLERGVLSELTHGEPGLLNSHALLRCTPDSMIGRWWGSRRGHLTQAIFRLDARAFWFPPAAAAVILRKHGPAEVAELLEKEDRSLASPADLRGYLERTDVGRYLAGSDRTASETRGRPAEEARRQLARVAQAYGYGGARDKVLNKAVLEAMVAFLPTLDITVAAAANEQGLPFCSSLIPDNQIDVGDRILCVEYCWRSGEGLASGRRSEVAQYALEKLRNYAVNLGWIEP